MQLIHENGRQLSVQAVTIDDQPNFAYSEGRPLTLNYIIITVGNRVSNEFSVDIK